MSEPNTTTTPSTGSATADRAIVLTERVHAAPEDVFEFLVDPEKVLRWMGTAIEIEPEPGGKFWLNATGTDIASGSYLEIDPGPNQHASE